MLIESLQNPRIKQIVRLRERQERDGTGLFLIEGFREITRALDASCQINDLYYCPNLFLGINEERLIERAIDSGAIVFECREQAFRKISYRDRPDGLLAVAPKQKKTLEGLKFKGEPLLVVAESIEKPGNLGTILRTSDAAGVDGLIVSDPCTDIHNPNVVRASTGTLFTVPVVEASTEETIAYLKKNKILIVAATPSATQNYTEIDYKGPIAIAVGTEQLGLTSKWFDNADLQVKIPMLGHADSLNVAQATTILLYEAVRQRLL